MKQMLHNYLLSMLLNFQMKSPCNVKPADFLYFCTLKSERHNEIETKL